MLPDDFVFLNLNTLANHIDDVAEAMSHPPQRDPARIWFNKIDAMLRSPSDTQMIISETVRFQKLVKSNFWKGFLASALVDAREIRRIRTRLGCFRSLWGVTPNIGLTRTVIADRSIGVDAESLVFTGPCETSAFDINLAKHVEVLLAGDQNLHEALCWMVLCWALISYDIFFFFNDRGILLPTEPTGRFTMGINIEELSLIRRADKLLYTLAYGADYRTRGRATAQGHFNYCMDCPSVGAFCFCNDEKWPAVFHPIAAYATAMLGAGLATREIPGARRFDYVVVDTAAIKPVYSHLDPGRNIRILHVANHGFFKGTRYLEAAIKQLKDEGAPIEFTLVSDVSNDEALELMRGSDILVDQLISGYFGQAALEGMALGKVVIVYLADPSLVLAPQECPLINANPDTVYSVLKELIEAPIALAAVGQLSRRYVENHYSIPALGHRLRELYRETAGITLSSNVDASPVGE